MTTAASERYREHQIWQILRLKIDALKTARFSNQSLENTRIEMITILEYANRSKGNPKPSIYDDVLEALQSTLNSLSTEEGAFAQFTSYSLPSLLPLVRQLPGPPPGQVNKQYLEALDSAIAMREQTISDLRTEIGALRQNVASAQKELTVFSSEVQKQNLKITADAATITQVANTAEEQLETEWKNRLATWDLERATKDQKVDEDLATKVRLLAGSASIGQRLLEFAAGRVTATEWAGRATRERRNAISLRLGSIITFMGAVAVGAYILSVAVTEGFQLTVGDGILRGALILALIGVGSFLSVEARRHFKEADSAEEVSLALTAIEPFYENADSTERANARASLGDAVFVKNVLSRFASRDATKHANTTSQELSGIADLLANGSTIGKIMNPGG